MPPIAPHFSLLIVDTDLIYILPRQHTVVQADGNLRITPTHSSNTSPFHSLYFDYSLQTQDPDPGELVLKLC